MANTVALVLFKYHQPQATGRLYNTTLRDLQQSVPLNSDTMRFNTNVEEKFGCHQANKKR